MINGQKGSSEWEHSEDKSTITLVFKSETCQAKINASSCPSGRQAQECWLAKITHMEMFFYTSERGTASHGRIGFSRWSSSQPDGGRCERKGSRQKLFLERWTGNLLCSVGWSGCEDKLQGGETKQEKEMSMNVLSHPGFKIMSAPDDSCKHATRRGNNVDRI